MIVEAARAWHVSPSVFMGEPVITKHVYDHAGRLARTETIWWTPEDREAALALLDYEARLCSGCNHPLEETTKAEHADAYRPGEPIRCHYCTARAVLNRSLEKEENTVGLLIPIKLNPEVVELNKQPVPPLPPELGG